MTLNTCPDCGTPTTPSSQGHRSLCLPCTELDLGMTYVQLRTRVNEALGKGKTRKWKR